MEAGPVELQRTSGWMEFISLRMMDEIIFRPMNGIYTQHELGMHKFSWQLINKVPSPEMGAWNRIGIPYNSLAQKISSYNKETK